MNCSRLLRQILLFPFEAIWVLRQHNLNIHAICYLFECHVTRTSLTSVPTVAFFSERISLSPCLRLFDNRWRKTLSLEESKIFNDSTHSRRKRGPASLMRKQIENGVDNYDNYS
ncbi:uncharacterized protein TNCV_3511551 [Trichonephila clavipes]|nr:uncharacterized protein TNCV_3511551 [Trichonephila clavipes]